jgi:thiol-disulfide isomerase/thioredoxin
MLSPKTKSVLADILSGLIPAVIPLTSISYFELSHIYLFVSATSLIAGFIRGKQNFYERIVQIALINSPYFLFIFSLLGGALHYAVIPVISITGTSIGLYLRTLKRAFPIKPAILLSAYLLGVILLGFVAAPAFLQMMFWSEARIKYSDFKLLDAKNDTIYSQDLNNKVIVMDFWATWCKPCVRSFPVMQEFYNKYRNNDKVKFLIINTGQRDTKEKALDFIGRNHYDLPFAFDLKQQVTKRYGVASIPRIIIIDKKRVPRFIHYGYDGSSGFKEDFIAKIDSLLNEK